MVMVEGRTPVQARVDLFQRHCQRTEKPHEWRSKVLNPCTPRPFSRIQNIFHQAVPFQPEAQCRPT